MLYGSIADCLSYVSKSRFAEMRPLSILEFIDMNLPMWKDITIVTLWILENTNIGLNHLEVTVIANYETLQEIIQGQLLI